MSKEFTIQCRVYFEDTDCGGIVYHANYLKFCERARSDLIRTLGLSQSELLQSNSGFVIAKMQARFLKPARFNDLLTVSCRVIKLRRVAVEFLQEVRSEDGTVLFSMQCEIGFINFASGMPQRLPAAAAQLQNYLDPVEA